MDSFRGARARRSAAIGDGTREEQTRRGGTSPVCFFFCSLRHTGSHFLRHRYLLFPKHFTQIIKKWRLRSIIPAFERWKEFITERKVHRRDLLKRMIARWSRAELWRGWRTWQHWVEAQRVNELKQSMVQQKVKHKQDVIRRWRLQSLLPAFERWKEFVSERKVHKRELLKRMIMRWSKNELWR